MSYLNRRISIYGLNINCLLVDLTLFKFGSDFSKHLALIEALRLNDNHLYDTPVNLQTCNLADVPKLFWCVLCKSNLYGLKGGCHNIFKAVKLPTIWLKIPKSVNVTDFPLEQLLST